LEAKCEPVLRFDFPHQAELADRLQRHREYGGLVVTSPRAVRALAMVFDGHPSWRAAWTEQPAFVVGPKTASALRAEGFAPEGETSGSAAALVSVIANKEVDKPLLFCVGNRRRDTLPDGLTDAGIPFEEVEVYVTRTRDDVALPDGARADWLIFFSPSGIEAIRQSPGVAASTFRIGAIGPTTGAALREAGWMPEAVASEPTPEALVDAVGDAL
jgi:uroporphyrinogen-III synthase